jgi:hypothetical protein
MLALLNAFIEKLQITKMVEAEGLEPPMDYQSAA